MATYTQFTASYGINYANLRVRILEQNTGIPAIVMASATSGILSSNGNAMTDSSGNLSVYLDSSKTFQVWYNQFQLVPNTSTSLSQMVSRTAAQLAGTPSLSDIGLGPGATFYLDTNPTAEYRINAAKNAYSPISGGGGGGGSFSTLTGNATDNSSLASALSAKLGTPSAYTAATNTPAIAAGTAPSNGNAGPFLVQDTGVVATDPALQNDIPFLRNGDMVIWSSGLNKWVRSAGNPISIAVSSALTLNDAHNDCTLVCTGSPAITLGSGRMPGFGVIFLGPLSIVTSGTTCPDSRRSIGDGTGYSFINQTTDVNTYRWDGGKV